MWLAPLEKKRGRKAPPQKPPSCIPVPQDGKEKGGKKKDGSAPLPCPLVGKKRRMFPPPINRRGGKKRGKKEEIFRLYQSGRRGRGGDHHAGHLTGRAPPVRGKRGKEKGKKKGGGASWGWRWFSRNLFHSAGTKKKGRGGRQSRHGIKPYTH